MEFDGLPIAKSGKWAETKYELVTYYSTLFSRAMQDKWECRVYLDLFSGPGYAQIKGTVRIVPTSPILALDISPPFDRYIFSEINRKNREALLARTHRDYPKVKVEVLLGDTNNIVEQIIFAIPTPSRSFKVLSFCFLDPYRIENLHFDTVRNLSKMYMDFLILIPTHMDIHRNMDAYCDETNPKMDQFLGNRDWRIRWLDQLSAGRKFGNFIANEFGMQMRELGYIYDGLDDTVLVRMPQKNIPLYRLAFFSRNQVGMKLWREAKKNTDQQLHLL